MKVILILLISFQLNAQCLNMDIFIVGDFSSSVKGNEEFVVEAIKTFASTIHGENVRVGVALFDKIPKLISELSNDPIEIISLVDHYKDAIAVGGTDIDPALQMGANILLTDNNSSRKLIILISDGDTDFVEKALLTAKQIRQVGIGLCSVLIKNNTQKPEFMKEISNGCYVETEYGNLASELRSLNICL